MEAQAMPDNLAWPHSLCTGHSLLLEYMEENN
jgi:hypothetical protein